MSKQPKTHSEKWRYQYAVKFICTANIPGTSQTTDGLLPGTYLTAVNIHNPECDEKVEIRKKLASPLGISKYKTSVLKPDGVERVTCAQIPDFDIRVIHGFEGFLVIESVKSIDVTAVYTAGGKDGNVVSIDVEQIKQRKLK